MDSIGRSREDYLEAILMLTRKNGACRSTDIAEHLGFSKPSVSVALKKLEDEGYIIKDEWKILLSDSGMKVAENLLSKHEFFKKLLKDAGIEDNKAEEEGCQMEHVLSDDSFLKLRTYLGR